MKKKTSSKSEKTKPAAKAKVAVAGKKKVAKSAPVKPAAGKSAAKISSADAARKAKVAKPVVAEVMYENVGPTPLSENKFETDKAYSLLADDPLDVHDDSFNDVIGEQISEHTSEHLDGDLGSKPIKGFVDEESPRRLRSRRAATSTKSLVPSFGSGSISSTDPLAIYLNDIRKYPVLTKEKEAEIARKYYETKDPEAAQTLIKSNLRFVVKVAADYSRFGAKMIDLIQEGNVGLMHAVREYNPYKGARLITYAVWWIRGYIQEYLMRQYSMVRIGTTQNQRRLFYQLQKEKEALDAMGQQPNLALLSSRLGIPEDEIEQMSQRMSGRDVSLDRPLDDESGSSLMDMQKSTADMSLDDKIAHEEQLDILKQKIEALRPELSEREKIILDERILNDEPLTLQEIGEKHGITREAVRQMEARVLKKIKARMETES